MAVEPMGADEAAEPRRCAPPRTYPGGVRTLGPLLVIPGRTLDLTQLHEGDTLVDSITQAIQDMRAEFPETGRSA